LTPRATRAPAGGFRPGLVHVDGAAAKHCAVQLGYRLVGFPDGGHLNECKAARLARVPIANEIHSLYSAEFLENFPDGFFSGAKIQISNKDVLHSVSLSRLRPAWWG
jgi:hypothetical protein